MVQVATQPGQTPAVRTVAGWGIVGGIIGLILTLGVFFLLMYLAARLARK